MNKFIAEIELKNLPKSYEDRYQLNLKLLFVNDAFIFNNEERNKDKMFFTSVINGFSLYSYSFGKIFTDQDRLRLPDSFFYDKTNKADNTMSATFNRDILRYEYLKSLKECLEDWAFNWEGFKEINDKCNIGFKQVIMNKQFWIL